MCVYKKTLGTLDEAGLQIQHTTRQTRNQKAINRRQSKKASQVDSEGALVAPPPM